MAPLEILHTSRDLWSGLGIGLVIGVVVGATWERGYELVIEAHKERTAMIEHKSDSAAEKTGNFLHRLWHWLGGINVLTLILVVATVNIVFIGVLWVVQGTRMSNYIQCQAEYNQQSALARDARIEPMNDENDALYAWLATWAPLLSARENTKPEPEQIEAFKKTYEEAIKAHEDRVNAQEQNPYPDPPEDNCGDY